MSVHLDALPDGVVVVAADGTVTAANAMAGRLAGVTADRLVGQPAAQLLALTDEHGADWWATACPLRADPTVAPRIPETLLDLHAADGRRRPVTLTAARTGTTHTDRLVVTLRDAGRRRRDEVARSELISRLSHDIRSPLTGVKGFTATLRARWDRFTDAQRREMLATIEVDADRVAVVLSELLDSARVEAGRLPLTRRMVDVAAVIEQVMQARRSAAQDLEVALPDALPAVHADPQRLAQALGALVDLGLGRGPARVTAGVADSDLTIRVEDAGPTPSAAESRALLTPSGAPSLGVYLARGIVEAHRGHLRAEPRTGGGLATIVALPLGGPQLAGASAAATRPTGDPTTEPQGRT